MKCAVGGALIRGEDEGRVNFLAQVRNKALEPLWRLANSSAPSSSKLLRGHANGIQPWKADRIIFMNDVFVCARDFARLLLHDADMACALDFGDRDQVGVLVQDFSRMYLCAPTDQNAVEI